MICPYPVDLRCGEECETGDSQGGQILEAVAEGDVEHGSHADVTVVHTTLTEDEVCVDRPVTEQLDLRFEGTSDTVVGHAVGRLEMLLGDLGPDAEPKHVVEEMEASGRGSVPGDAVGVVAIDPPAESTGEPNAEPVQRPELHTAVEAGRHHGPFGPEGQPDAELGANRGIAPVPCRVLLAVLRVVGFEDPLRVGAGFLVDRTLLGHDAELALRGVGRRHGDEVEDEDEDDRDELLEHGALL